MSKSGKPNLIILGATGALVIFGLFMITSASGVLAQEKFNQSFYFVKNQLLKGLIPGLILGYLAFLIPFRYWRKFAGPFFLVALLLTGLVYLPPLGTTFGGAKRWIHLGSLVFQPSEILKLTFIIYLASFLAKAREVENKIQKKIFFPFLVILAIVGTLLAFQPDIGTLGVFILTAMTMYFVAKTPIHHIIILSAMGFATLISLIKIFPHALQRIQVLFHPELYQKNIGYQLDQGLIALGSGGIFGQGLAQGKQKFLYLPQPAGDSIVAVIGEELGFIGLLILVSLFVTLAVQGLKIARSAPDEFSKLLAAGLTFLIVIQAFINIMAIIGLIPLTGVTLPFISYGGTSLTISLIAVGILLNISKYSKT